MPRSLEDFEYKHLTHSKKAVAKRFFLLAAELSPALPDGPRKTWFLETLYQSKVNAVLAIDRAVMTDEEVEKLNAIENFDPTQEISTAYQINSEGER